MKFNRVWNRDIILCMREIESHLKNEVVTRCFWVIVTHSVFILCNLFGHLTWNGPIILMLMQIMSTELGYGCITVHKIGILALEKNI